MKEEYRKAAFELFEELLIKYDLYSQITINTLTFYKRTLSEFFDYYYNTHCGDIHKIFACYGRFNLEREWIEELCKLREKYKIYPI